MKGYVYIISNPAMPGIFKIGFTRKNPELRAKEFDSTGVPHPYVVEYEILVDEPHALEQRVHKSLRAQREGKEWFRCSFTQAVQGIRTCYQGKIYREKCFKTEREKELERVRQEQILRDLEQKRKEEERIRIQKERQKQAEERIRIQKQEALRKKSAEEEQRKIDRFVFKKAFTIFLYLEALSILGTYFIITYYNHLSDAWFHIFILLSLASVNIVIKIEELSSERWIKEYKHSESTNGTQSYHLQQRTFSNKQKETIIITCPNCRTRLRVGKLLHIQVHCPVCSSVFSIKFNIFGTVKYSNLDNNTPSHDSQQLVHFSPQQLRQDQNINSHVKVFETKGNMRELALEHAWNEELVRRGWATRQSRSSTISQLISSQKTITHSQSTSFRFHKPQRYADLELAWNEELVRRGWLTRQSSTSIDLLSQNSKQNTYPQATTFNAQGSKRDLELERAWQKEEERRRREREARKIRQDDKVGLGDTKRGLELERTRREEDVRGQQKQEAKDVRQGVKVGLGGTKRDLELERAWREEEERRRREREARKIRQDDKVGLGDTKRGLELERTRREEDVRGQQKQEAKDIRQGVKVVLGGTKRDLELERAWREEEERRRREREARKLQQGGKVIIACIECGQKLRVSNAPYLHVRCPKCSCRFYWENK